MKASFNDRIDVSNNNFANFCEKFMYFHGISNRLGFHEYKVLRVNADSIEITQKATKEIRVKQIAITIAKLVSCIILPLLVVALVGKLINRRSHVYKIVNDENPQKVNHTFVKPKQQEQPPIEPNPLREGLKDEPKPNPKPEILPVVDPNLNPSKETPKVDHRYPSVDQNLNPPPNNIENKPLKGGKKEDLALNPFEVDDDSEIDIPEKRPPGYEFVGKNNNVWMLSGHIREWFLLLQQTYAELNVLPACNTIENIAKAIFYSYFEVDDKNNVVLPTKLFSASILHISENHWAFVFIDRQKRTLEFYDSKVNYGNHNEIVHELKRIAKELTEKDPGDKPYQFIKKINNSLQPDSFNCGPWVSYFAEKRLKYPDIDFNQLNINEAQKIINKYRSILTSKLIKAKILRLQGQDEAIRKRRMDS